MFAFLCEERTSIAPTKRVANSTHNATLKPSKVKTSLEWFIRRTQSKTIPATNIITKVAVNPPTFTKPLTAPRDFFDTNDREKSKAIIEVGLLTPRAIIQHQSIQFGAA